MKTMAIHNTMGSASEFSGERKLYLSQRTSFEILVTRAGENYRLYLHSPKDQPGILYTVSALLYTCDINIKEASAVTSPSGEVVDSFLLEPAGKQGAAVFRGRKLKKLVEDLEKLLSGQLNVVQYLRDVPEKWKALTAARKMSGVELHVEPLVVKLSEKEKGTLQDQPSWVIHFSADDRPGLLYDLTKTLYLLYFDVLELESTTAGTRALDRIVVCRTPERAGSTDYEILMEALSAFS